MLEKSFDIVSATRNFECALAMWEDTQDSQKKYATFKTHFHEEQQDIKRPEDQLMQQSAINHSNSLAQSISLGEINLLRTRECRMLKILQSISSLRYSSQHDDSTDSQQAQVVANISQIKDST